MHSDAVPRIPHAFPTHSRAFPTANPSFVARPVQQKGRAAAGGSGSTRAKRHGMPVSAGLKKELLVGLKTICQRNGAPPPYRILYLELGLTRAYEPGDPSWQSPVQRRGRQRRQPRCRSGSPATKPSGPGAKLGPPEHTQHIARLSPPPWTQGAKCRTAGLAPLLTQCTQPLLHLARLFVKALVRCVL
jgi:hypothetical protein